MNLKKFFFFFYKYDWRECFSNFVNLKPNNPCRMNMEN